jgi:hypothetical protein
MSWLDKQFVRRLSDHENFKNFNLVWCLVSNNLVNEQGTCYNTHCERWQILKTINTHKYTTKHYIFLQQTMFILHWYKTCQFFIRWAMSLVNYLIRSITCSYKWQTFSYINGHKDIMWTVIFYHIFALMSTLMPTTYEKHAISRTPSTMSVHCQ